MRYIKCYDCDVEYPIEDMVYLSVSRVYICQNCHWDRMDDKSNNNG